MVDGQSDVHTWGVDGSAPARVTSDPGEDWSCSWSPDGDRLVFHSLRDGDFEIMSVAPDGTGERRLTDNDGMDMLPRWSPDGDSIAFISDASGEIEVYLMSADGSDVRNVSQDPALDDGIYGIDWTPDGATIVAASMGRAYAPGDDASLRGAVGAIALVAVILGLIVGLLLRFRPQVGTFTIALSVTGLLVGLLGDSLTAVIAFLVAGVATDAVGAWASARPGTARASATGGIAAAVLTATTFVVGGVEAGLAWDGELVIGVTLLAGLVGAGCAAIAARPARSTRLRIRRSRGPPPRIREFPRDAAGGDDAHRRPRLPDAPRLATPCRAPQARAPAGPDDRAEEVPRAGPRDQLAGRLRGARGRAA